MCHRHGAKPHERDVWCVEKHVPERGSKPRRDGFFWGILFCFSSRMKIKEEEKISHHVSRLLNFFVTTLPKSMPSLSTIRCARSGWLEPENTFMFGILFICFRSVLHLMDLKLNWWMNAKTIVKLCNLRFGTDSELASLPSWMIFHESFVHNRFKGQNKKFRSEWESWVKSESKQTAKMANMAVSRIKREFKEVLKWVTNAMLRCMCVEKICDKEKWAIFFFFSFLTSFLSILLIVEAYWEVFREQIYFFLLRDDGDSDHTIVVRFWGFPSTLYLELPCCWNKKKTTLLRITTTNAPICDDDLTNFSLDEHFCRSEEIAQCSIKLELVNDCFTELRGEISGPPGEFARGN